MEFYQLPLAQPPQPRWIGIGRHGDLALEKFLIPDFWCLHFYRDPMQLRVGARWFEVRPGCVTLIAPATPIEFHFPQKTKHTHVFAHFRAGEGGAQPFPALRDLGARFEELCASLSEAASFGTGDCFDSPRAQARLWEILWQLAQPPVAQITPRQALVERAVQLIEARLNQALGVAQLARELGVSHNHLTRCFAAHTGQTPVVWMRAARVRRARYLLQNTTAPMGSIARQTGLGDIHSFNKAVRRETGRSPSALRGANPG